MAIGGGFCNSKHIRKLDFSGCGVDGEGAYKIAQIIGFHEQLESMDMCAVFLGSSGGEKLLENVSNHYNLVHLECRGCGMIFSEIKQKFFPGLKYR